MPIITKPASIEKNSLAEISLDKSALAAIVSNLYFQDSDNWKSVDMVFVSNPGNQRKVIKFDAAQLSPLASFYASAKAENIFEIKKIVINDFDGGKFTILRVDIPNATTEFDIDMGGPTIDPVTFELFQNYPTFSPSVDPTTLTRTFNSIYTPISIALSNQSLGALSSGVGNFDVTFNLDNLSNTSGYGTWIGILFSDSDSGSISMSEVSTNYETSTYGLVVDTNSSMGTVTIGTAGYASSTGVSGTTKSIRLLQEGDNQLKIYQDGNLINTITIANTSKPYAYPFLRSSFQHTLTSAVAVIDNDLPNIFIQRDFSTTEPSGWGEIFNGNPIIDNALQLGSYIYQFSYPQSPSSPAFQMRAARVFFDTTTAEVGLNFKTGNGNQSSFAYSSRTLTLTEIQNGYFDTEFASGYTIGTSYLPTIWFQNTPTPGKLLRITKIQIGGEV